MNLPACVQNDNNTEEKPADAEEHNNSGSDRCVLGGDDDNMGNDETLHSGTRAF